MTFSDHPYVRTQEDADASEDIEMSRRGAIAGLIAYFSTSAKNLVKKWWEGGNDESNT